MIKALKKKFIFTSMVAVTVLLVALFVIQNVSNYTYMNSHTDMILDELARLYGIKSDFSMDQDYDDLKIDSQGGASEGELPSVQADGESDPGVGPDPVRGSGWRWCSDGQAVRRPR